MFHLNGFFKHYQSGLYDISDQKHKMLTQSHMVSKVEGLKGRVIFLAPARIEMEPIKKLFDQFNEVILAGINLSTLEYVATGYKEKVKCIECDLSGGLCEEVQRLATEILNYPPEKRPGHIDTKLNDLIDNFTPDIKSLIKKLGYFNYVVSSNLGSQIGSNLIEFMINKCRSWDFSKIHDRFINKGMRIHLTVLKALATEKICFIDTLAYTKYNQPRVELADSGFNSFLTSNFTVIDRANWDWYSNKTWHVFAFHLEKRQTKRNQIHDCDCTIL